MAERLLRPWATFQSATGLDGIECHERVIEGGNGNHRQTIGNVTYQVWTVIGGCKKPGRSILQGALHLVADTTDRSDSALCINRARSGDDLPFSEVLLGHFFDDAERKHQSSARAADVLERNIDVEGKIVGSRHENSDHGYSL